MKSSLPLFAAVSFAATLLVSCSAPSEFEQIPATPFTAHLKKTANPATPFLSHWEHKAEETAEPAATAQAAVSRRRVCLKLNNDYFQSGEELDKKGEKKLNKLRTYLGRTLRKELRRNPKLRLTDAPGPDTDVVEVALLRAEDSATAKLLLTQGAGKMVAGGVLTDGVLNNDADKGYICMAVKVSAPDGTLLAELADFEYGGKEQGITDGLISAAAPVDPNLLIPYGYQRQTIDKWAKELSVYLATGAFPVSVIPTTLPKVPKPADVVKKAVPTDVLPTDALPAVPKL